MNFRDLYLSADYRDNKGMLFNCDCLEIMDKLIMGGKGRYDINRPTIWHNGL